MKSLLLAGLVLIASSSSLAGSTFIQSADEALNLLQKYHGRIGLDNQASSKKCYFTITKSARAITLNVRSESGRSASIVLDQNMTSVQGRIDESFDLFGKIHFTSSDAKINSTVELYSSDGKYMDIAINERKLKGFFSRRNGIKDSEYSTNRVDCRTQN